MPKCDFIKFALQLYLNHTPAWAFLLKSFYAQIMLFSEKFSFLIKLVLLNRLVK